LKEIARKEGCYKVILNCAEKNEEFYKKCGFQRKEIQMAYYFPEFKNKL
jgi:glucosamine-phosphate N-acetyltransferase